MKLTYALTVALILVCAGCGKEERTEAVRLSKALSEKQADFNSATAKEKELVDNGRAFCAAITAHGAGKGQELAQNAGVATQLANSAVEISSHLSSVRGPVYDMSLKQEYPQSLRANLITELTKRQRYLQDIRTMLQQAAADFEAYQKQKGFTGEAVPEGLGKLNALLEAYKPPQDIVGATLADLKSKYNLTSADI